MTKLIIHTVVLFLLYFMRYVLSYNLQQASLAVLCWDNLAWGESLHGLVNAKEDGSLVVQLEGWIWTHKPSNNTNVRDLMRSMIDTIVTAINAPRQWNWNDGGGCKTLIQVFPMILLLSIWSEIVQHRNLIGWKKLVSRRIHRVISNQFLAWEILLVFLCQLV